jgi:hypothetical protein
VTSASTTITVDPIDVITVIAGPIIAMTIGINVIIDATTAVMIGVTTIVATTAMTVVMTARVIAVTTSAVTTEMIIVMIDDTRTTTIATTRITWSDLHRHHLKGATLMVHSNPPTER